MDSDQHKNMKYSGDLTNLLDIAHSEDLWWFTVFEPGDFYSYYSFPLKMVIFHSFPLNMVISIAMFNNQRVKPCEILAERLMCSVHDVDVWRSINRGLGGWAADAALGASAKCYPAW